MLNVISLDRTPERFAQFRQWNPGFAVSRFAAFDGARLDRAQCVRDGLIAEDNRYAPGAIGNAMSHVALWRRCAAGSVPMTVVEDDIILRDDFPAMSETALATVSGWDVALWTHNFDWPLKILPAPGIGPAVVQYDPAGVLRQLDAFRSWTGAPTMPRLVSAAGIGCYSISPRGAARMLADCLPIGRERAAYSARPGVAWDNTALDVEMSRHYEAWRAHVAVPPLALAPNDQATSTVLRHLAARREGEIPGGAR